MVDAVTKLKNSRMEESGCFFDSESELEQLLLQGCSINAIFKLLKGKPLRNDRLRLQLYRKVFGSGQNARSNRNGEHARSEADANGDLKHGDILQVLTALEPATNEDRLQILDGIVDFFIVNNSKKTSNVYCATRLLLQYHDPELCSFLDTKKVHAFDYSFSWFQTLFASTFVNVHEPQTALALWDFYFTYLNPFFIFFLTLVLVLNSRDVVLKLTEKKDIIEALRKSPETLTVADVNEFCVLAQYYDFRTPQYFKDHLQNIFTRKETDVSKEHFNQVALNISQALCLPISAGELLEALENNEENRVDECRNVSFIFVDCRVPDQFNAGHLKIAHYFDCSAMMNENIVYKLSIEMLIESQQKEFDSSLSRGANVSGGHLCFIGSGRPEEDQFMNMVVSQFLQLNVKYISIFHGGFAVLHDYLFEKLDAYFEDHNPDTCTECQAKKTAASEPKASRSTKKYTSAEFMNFISKGVKDKLKLLDLSKSDDSKSAEKKRAATENRHPKTYRNISPVFDMSGDLRSSTSRSPSTSFSKNSSLEYEETKELASLDSWKRSPELTDLFECKEVTAAGEIFPSYLALTKIHLVVLRVVDSATVEVVVRRALGSIIKIMTKKRHPNLISFQYGEMDSNNSVHQLDVDRFLIQNYKHVISVISNQISENNNHSI